MKLDGIALLQKIKTGEIKEYTKIMVYHLDISTKVILIVARNTLIWKPGEFMVGKLWNQEYSFEIIKDSQDLDRECFNFFKSEFDKANLLEKKLIDCVNILQKEVREIKKGIYKNEK